KHTPTNYAISVNELVNTYNSERSEESEIVAHKPIFDFRFLAFARNDKKIRVIVEMSTESKIAV
ncbi:MAG: hypothetical protein OXI16_07775, partial [Chloroflexota bacterium]|nr:hypothetical protein [Chloroflexota bacterium]